MPPYEYNTADQLFEEIKHKNDYNKPLTKGEIQFLIDAVEGYGRDEGYWPWDVLENAEKGKYN